MIIFRITGSQSKQNQFVSSPFQLISSVPYPLNHYLTFNNLIQNIVMQQIAEYFNRFYQTVLKDHIQDAVVHSEWLYFLSMFKTPSLDKERIDLYLGILNNQKGRRNDRQMREGSSSPDPVKVMPESNFKLISSGEIFMPADLKLEKRLSENWKPSLTNPKLSREVKVPSETFHIKRTTSTEDEHNRSLRSIEEESKTIRIKNDQMYTLPSCSPNSYAYIRPKSSHELAAEKEAKLKERHMKLLEISEKLVGAFQGVRLRA